MFSAKNKVILWYFFATHNVSAEASINQPTAGHFKTFGGPLLARGPRVGRPCYKSCIQSFAFLETTTEVTRHITAMKIHTVPGRGGISSKFIKLAKVIVAPFLAKLCNNSVDQNTFPKNFELAIVTPNTKTSSPKSMNNFCSISLLLIFSKIFEKIIAERMMSFTNKNGILTSSQFGFRTGSLTELVVTSIYDELPQHFDDNKLTCFIFLDLRKAFDSIDHSIRLKKRNHYGLRSKTLNFLSLI